MLANLETLEEYLEDSEALFLEPRTMYDEAIIGVAERADGMMVVGYDADLCIEALMTHEGWDRDEAVDFFEANVSCSGVGPGTPVFITKFIK